MASATPDLAAVASVNFVQKMNVDFASYPVQYM